MSVDLRQSVFKLVPFFRSSSVSSGRGPQGPTEIFANMAGKNKGAAVKAKSVPKQKAGGPKDGSAPAAADSATVTVHPTAAGTHLKSRPSIINH